MLADVAEEEGEENGGAAASAQQRSGKSAGEDGAVMGSVASLRSLGTKAASGLKGSPLAGLALRKHSGAAAAAAARRNARERSSSIPPRMSGAQVSADARGRATSLSSADKEAAAKTARLGAPGSGPGVGAETLSQALAGVSTDRVAQNMQSMGLLGDGDEVALTPRQGRRRRGVSTGAAPSALGGSGAAAGQRRHDSDVSGASDGSGGRASRDGGAGGGGGGGVYATVADLTARTWASFSDLFSMPMASSGRAVRGSDDRLAARAAPAPAPADGAGGHAGSNRMPPAPRGSLVDVGAPALSLAVPELDAALRGLDAADGHGDVEEGDDGFELVPLGFKGRNRGDTTTSNISVVSGRSIYHSASSVAGSVRDEPATIAAMGRIAGAAAPEQSGGRIAVVPVTRSPPSSSISGDDDADSDTDSDTDSDSASMVSAREELDSLASDAPVPGTAADAALPADDDVDWGESEC